MSEADRYLTIVAASACKPSGTNHVSGWLDQVEQCVSDDCVTPYRGLTEILFGELGVPLSEHIGRTAVLRSVSSDQSFRDAGSMTQADMACQALQNLFDDELAAEQKDACRLTIYSTSSIDENFFQSTIGRLASEFGLSRHAHFALGQMQSASTIAAIDLADAMLRDEQTSAAFVASEKWMLPYPRTFPFPTLLGDAAGAIFVRRCDDCGLRVLGTIVIGHDPFLTPGHDWADGRERAINSVVEAADKLCRRLSMRIDELDGAVPAGIGRDFDDVVAARLGLGQDFAVAPSDQDGYLAAASTPILIADLLHKVRIGAVSTGSRFLIWGISMGGVAAAMVVEAINAGEPQ